MFSFSVIFLILAVAAICNGEDLTRNPCVLPNGHFKIEGICGAYVECKEYSASLQLCQNGHYFNPDAAWPAYPCDSVMHGSCREPIETTTKLTTMMVPTATIVPTTTMAPTTLNPPTENFICKSQNSYHKVDRICGAYVECKESYEGVLRLCQNGQYFNPDVAWPAYPCDAYMHGFCGDLIETTPKIITTLAPTTLYPPKEGIMCKSRNSFHKVDGMCGAYVECKDSYEGILKTCRNGHNFNPYAIWPSYPCDSNIPCEDSSHTNQPVPTTSYPIPIVTVTQPTPTARFDDPTRITPMPTPSINTRDPACMKRYGYFEVGGKCDEYIECKRSSASHKRCPDGLFFDPKANYPDYPCKYPKDVVCMAGRTSQPPIATEACPHQYGVFPSLDASPSRCGLYTVCIAGIPKPMECPTGLAFNIANATCDWPDQVESCDVDSFLGFKCPEIPVDLDGKPLDIVLNYRHEGSCYAFFSCDKGRARLLTCEDGLAFDPEANTCVYREDVICDH